MQTALDRAHAHAAAWLGSLVHRPVPARMTGISTNAVWKGYS